jgi:hypothetical protein
MFLGLPFFLDCRLISDIKRPASDDSVLKGAEHRGSGKVNSLSLLFHVLRGKHFFAKIKGGFLI